jgi:hypothetical protein
MGAHPRFSFRIASLGNSEVARGGCASGSDRAAFQGSRPRNVRHRKGPNQPLRGCTHLRGSPRKDHRGVDRISNALPFGHLWYAGPKAISNAVGFAKFNSRSHDAVIRVYDEAGNVIETHEHTCEFKLNIFAVRSFLTIPISSACRLLFFIYFDCQSTSRLNSVKLRLNVQLGTS